MSKKKKISTSRFVNAKITSTISVTLVLVLLGMTILVWFLGNGLSGYVKENISFSIILDTDITDAQIQRIRKDIDSQPFVKASRYVSKEEAKDQLIKDLGEDPEELLGYNPAYDAIEIFLYSEYANSDSIAHISKVIKEKSNVDDLLYRQEAIDLINDNISKITAVLLVISLVLLFISFALIRNTIRLSIYSKRFIINTMKLVGANSSFIRKPFIRSNIINGVVAGVLANISILLILYYFNREYTEFRAFVDMMELGIVFAIVVFLGVIISVIATHFAVNRYLRMETDNLYYV